MDAAVLPSRADVVVVGGGHNALVAAAYLARAGVDVVVLERSDHLGGAAVSAEPWPGVEARLSRYSYLVSLLPATVVADLGLRLDLRSRPTASYSPVTVGGRPGGLYVEQPEGPATEASFAEVTGGSSAYAAWGRFYADVERFAAVVAPTLTGPLPDAAALREQVGGALWDDLVTRPLGETVEERFDDDLVRGVVATDALIGTFASLRDPGRVQNRCFLYHLVGNGTGEWRVPVGGMGAVTGALVEAARAAGARLVTGAEVGGVELGDGGAQVVARVGDTEVTVDCDHVLGGAAPAVLDRLRGREPRATPPGSQLKINLLLSRLPRLRSGADPRSAFAGTFHVHEAYSELETAYAEAAAGTMPTRPPGELYCHTLTDRSILGPSLAGTEAQTLTYFGLHTPPAVFDGPAGSPAHEEARAAGVRATFDALQEHLAEPLEDCLALDADGAPCVEAKTPLDLEESLTMPGGHIFHGDLGWPWLDEPAGDAPAHRWGVATDHPRLLVCGSGSQRGGAVSGLGGHSAAHALLETLGRS